MRKSRKKAALTAAFLYLAVLSLGTGMLRAAQRTRQTLYGGHPVMAQLSRTVPDDAEQSPGSYEMTLGGGEWVFTFTAPDPSEAERMAAYLPPCTLRFVLRLVSLADAAADYTAECISGAIILSDWSR